jgi:hypothetical protein
MTTAIYLLATGVGCAAVVLLWGGLKFWLYPKDDRSGE